jgi:nucleoside-diphosphate-sugar epimerase
MQSPKVLLTGATGYIGGTLLVNFLQSSDPALKSAKYFVLIRNASQGSLFKDLDVQTVLLENTSDASALRRLAADYDIIVNPAFAQNAELARGLVLGLGDRLKKNPNGPVPKIIQTTGTSNVADRPFTDPNRKLPFELTDLRSSEVYEVEKKLAAQEPYPQRDSELAVIDTGIETGVVTTIIQSPTIYGPGSGPGNKASLQIPIKACLQTGSPITSARASKNGTVFPSTMSRHSTQWFCPEFFRAKRFLLVKRESCSPRPEGILGSN